jgi:hypothetical protein
MMARKNSSFSIKLQKKTSIRLKMGPVRLTSGGFTNRLITVGEGQPTSYTWGWE